VSISGKISWAITALAVVAMAAMAWVFLVRGNVVESNDGRTAVMLSAGERDIVLAEMRGFLEGVQSITEGLATGDMKVVVDSALAVGMANVQEVPASLMSKLPLDFKALGMTTHKAFDDLAREARDMGNEKVVLGKLGDLLQNCTGCHAGYRLDIEKAGN